MDEKLLTLPFEIQLALGAGYAAYVVAYVGIRHHHTASDKVFRAIAFGLVATAILKGLPTTLGWWRYGLAIAAALLGGITWRLALADWSRAAFRASNLSWADDAPSAWATITSHNRRAPISQISVELDDGTWLFCFDTTPFKQSPFPVAVLGPEGDLALYVTHERVGIDGPVVELDDVIDPMHGDRLTHISANRIRRVSFRFFGPLNAVARAEV